MLRYVFLASALAIGLLTVPTASAQTSDGCTMAQAKEMLIDTVNLVRDVAMKDAKDGEILYDELNRIMTIDHANKACEAMTTLMDQAKKKIEEKKG